MTPRLVVADVAAFAAAGELVTDRPTVLDIGGSKLMVSGGGERELATAFLHVYVADVDATFARARAAGAEVVEAPWDTPYGDRRGMVRDPFGNRWQIARFGG